MMSILTHAYSHVASKIKVCNSPIIISSDILLPFRGLPFPYLSGPGSRWYISVPMDVPILPVSSMSCMESYSVHCLESGFCHCICFLSTLLQLSVVHSFLLLSSLLLDVHSIQYPVVGVLKLVVSNLGKIWVKLWHIFT